MFIEICGDCSLSNSGFSATEIGYDYSTEFQPLAMFNPTDCDTFYAGSAESKRWILTPVDCTGNDYDPMLAIGCEGHFSSGSCQGCGDPRGGARFCYTATRVSTRVDI